MTHTNHFQNICIVGNIGSGKSTLTQILGHAISNSVAIPEDFDQNPFLEPFIKNPTRWAFTNAVRYFYDYVREYHELTRDRSYAHCFIDAGGATNRHVYGRYLQNENVMTAEEYAFYDLLCNLIQTAYAYPEPDAYIFLHATPEQCFERMKQRGWRYQTENIALDYLRSLRKYFYAFQALLQENQVPVLELDSAALDFTRAEGQALVIERVRAFLGD